MLLLGRGPRQYLLSIYKCINTMTPETSWILIPGLRLKQRSGDCSVCPSVWAETHLQEPKQYSLSLSLALVYELTLLHRGNDRRWVNPTRRIKSSRGNKNGTIRRKSTPKQIRGAFHASPYARRHSAVNVNTEMDEKAADVNKLRPAD